MSRDSELEAVRRQLAEAHATLDAIRAGQVDAVMVDRGDDREVFTLQSADLPYREFIEQMDEGALSLDDDLTILYGNRYFAELVGVSRSNLVGKRFREWLTPDSQVALRAVMQSGRPKQLAVTLLTTGGISVPVRLGVVPPGARQNRYAIVVVSDRSIAEQLQHEMEARDVAEAASSAKDKFLAVLGHELRNPVAALASSVDLLQNDLLQPDQTQAVHSNMSRQVFQLQSLIDDLLDLSRVVHGKITLQRRRVNVRQMLQHACGSVQNLVDARGHTLNVAEITEDLFVSADRTRLEQVVINLLANAIKYTPPHGRVELSARRVADDVVIEVTDTGIGFEGSRGMSIFEAFVQLGEQGMGGLGIGLTLVKQLVELHDGRVEAESPGPDQGATFRVVLPLIDPSSPDAPPAPSVRPSGKFAGMRVLVVDDNTDAADLLALLLQAMGCDTLTANCGQDALEAARDREPRLVFLDLGLPDLSGYEVAHGLRAQWPDVKLVALTGFSHEEAKSKVKAAGFDAHVIKPLRVEDLSDLLSRFCGDE